MLPAEKKKGSFRQHPALGRHQVRHILITTVHHAPLSVSTETVVGYPGYPENVADNTARKPRNARSKREIEKREPKAVENPKATLLLRANKCSQHVQDALQDLYSLRTPFAKKFTKKNEIHPFEDPASLEFFSEKNDAAFLVFGSSTKKRPHSLIIARMFAHKVLDMLELHLDPNTHVAMPRFTEVENKPAFGLRPMLVFAGAAFENPVADEYTLAKSLLLDMFKGDVADQIDVEGLRYVILIAAGDGGGGGGGSVGGVVGKPPIHMRGYMIRTKRSGQRLPRVELEEMGPRMDLRIGRSRPADEGLLKEAMRKPRGTEEKTKKNIHLDPMGDKIGRIHMGIQDLRKLQTRKMKGLKRRLEDIDGRGDEGETTKKKRGD